MQVEEYDSPRPFLARAGAFLARYPAENNLIIGTAEAIPQGGTAFLATVHDGGTSALGPAVGAAVWTPPHRLLLPRCAPAVMSALAQHFAETCLRPRGVYGVDAAVHPFVQTYAALTGAFGSVVQRHRLYCLSKLVAPPRVAGTLELATEVHVEVVTHFWLEFWREASMGGLSSEEARTLVRSRLQRGEVFLWVDSEPRAMATLGRPTPDGIAVQYVYTHPSSRNRGYAKACVGALSRRALDSGTPACFLNADLANPISNQVYLSLGYQPIADALLFDFGCADDRVE